MVEEATSLLHPCWPLREDQSPVGRPPDPGIDVYDLIMQFDDVARLLKAFEREGVRYVLIGSMAMAARGIRRATQDIDFFIEPDEENVARLRKAMRSVYDDESIAEIRAEDLAGRYPVIRYGPPEGTVMIDLIARIGQEYQYDDIESDVMDIDGTAVPVATPRMLYEMKRGTLRSQDRADAEVLRSKFDLTE